LAFTKTGGIQTKEDERMILVKTNDIEKKKEKRMEKILNEYENNDPNSRCQIFSCDSKGNFTNKHRKYHFSKEACPLYNQSLNLKRQCQNHLQCFSIGNKNSITSKFHYKTINCPLKFINIDQENDKKMRDKRIMETMDQHKQSEQIHDQLIEVEESQNFQQMHDEVTQEQYNLSEKLMSTNSN